jgi:sugar lactone lactonase YvrE
MRTHTVIAVLVAAGLAAYLFCWPVAIDSVAWQPAPNPGLTGPFARNQPFTGLQPLVPEVGEGPEAVAHSPDGFLFTGLQDGRIVRFWPDGSGGAELVAQTGGRPLGLRLDAHGRLVVATGVSANRAHGC